MYQVLSIKYLKFIFALVAFSLLTTCYLLLTTKVQANSLDLGIFPPLLQIDALPPADITTPINIQNFGDETVDLQILLKPFTASKKENGEVSFPFSNSPIPGINPFILENSVQVGFNEHNIDSLTLAPGQEKTLQLHIGIPKDEPPSDYYFSVLFVSKSLSGEGNLTNAAGGIGTNVLLSIGPKGKAQGIIEEFSVPSFLEKGPVPFTVRINNTGKHAIAPHGIILIKNMFGQTVGKVDLLQVNILSQTIRALPDSSQSPEATPAGTINPSTSLPLRREASRTDISQLIINNSPTAFWHENFLLGPYTATLTVALSDDGPLFTQTIHFTGVPLQVTLGIIFAIVIIALIAYRVKKKLR